MLCLTALSVAGTAAAIDIENALSERNHLIQTVRENGSAALPELIQALADECDTVRLTAAHLIAAFDPPVRAGLEAGLQHDDIDIRRIMIRNLGDHGLLADYWLEVVSDESPVIQRETRLALLDAYISPLTGAARAKVLADFERAYQNGSPAIRLHIAEMLARMLKPGDQGWEILERATDAGNEKVAFRAAQLVVGPSLDRMKQLAGSRKWAELVEEFADLDPAGWPDQKLAAEAFSLRGRAYYNLKRGEEARADMERAVAVTPSRRDLTLLGHIWRDLLDNNEKAAENYIRAIGDGGGVRVELYSAILAAADVLRKMERYDEALAILAQADEDAIRRSGERLTDRWGFSVNRAIGSILIEQGRLAEAIKHYRSALLLEGFSDSNRSDMQKILDELQEN